jgi:hypothetical protein
LAIVAVLAATAAAGILLAMAFFYPLSVDVGGVNELTFVRTGGFIGLDEKLHIKEDGTANYTSNKFGDADLNLDGAEVADLRNRADFFTSDTVYNARSGPADFYIYRLTVQTGFDVKTIEWVDSWAAAEPLPSELGELQLHLESIIQRARDLSGVANDAQERAVEISTTFIVQAPTFKFDGINETLQVIDSVTLESFPEQHVTTITFDSRHAGYGDREGQALAQVITPHTARVTVVTDNVISAVLDRRWDEINQRLLNQTGSMVMEPEEVRDTAFGYIKENHPDVSVPTGYVEWQGGRSTPEKLVGHETYIYSGGDWNVTIEWSVVAPEYLVFEVRAEHQSGITWVGEVQAGIVTETSYSSD